MTRICVVLGVILLLSSIGMTLTSAAPNGAPPGQDQCDEGHGANDKPCVDDPSDHGHECEEHGNGGVNENHCESGGTTGGTTGGTSTGGSTTGGSTTGGSSTGEGTGNATGNSTGGSSTGEGTGNATGNSTGEGTTGETSTGNSTGEGTTGETSTGGSSTGGSTTGGSTTGTSTGGAENGTTTGTPAVNDDTEVLGKTITRKPLATTGNETTVLAVFGFAFLLLGSAMRFGRFGTRVAMATASPADALVARSLALIERSVRPGSRDWYCH